MEHTSKTLSLLGIPHTMEAYMPLECVIAHHFCVSEAAVSQYLDIEDGRHLFEEFALWLEECVLVVVDESMGTIQQYGVRSRARRHLIVSFHGSRGGVLRLPRVVSTLLLYATRSKTQLHVTKTCCRCYSYVFLFGFCIGSFGLGAGMWHLSDIFTTPIYDSLDQSY
jgi:hypothetical protein